LRDVAEVITLLLREEKNTNKTRKKPQTIGVGFFFIKEDGVTLIPRFTAPSAVTD